MTDRLLTEARDMIEQVMFGRNTGELVDLLSHLVARIEALDAELTEVKARLEARTGET